jgi:hypothetical protein
MRRNIRTKAREAREAREGKVQLKIKCNSKNKKYKRV